MNKIINFDFQGWPVEKMSIKDIIKAFGGTLNEATGKWEIENTAILETYPLVLEDDGMGYGVHEQWIASVDLVKSDKPYCNIFRESEIAYINVWIENNIQPGFEIKYNDKNYYLTDVHETDDGMKFKAINVEDPKDYCFIPESFVKQSKKLKNKIYG